MGRLKHCLIALIILFLVACGIALTRIYSIKNPDFSQIRIRTPLIFAVFQDMSIRMDFENAFLNYLAWNGIQAFSSVKEISPFKEHSKEEIDKILEEKKIDGILVIELKEYWEEGKYLPEISLSGFSISNYKNRLTGSGYTVKDGGYFFKVPRASFRIFLCDPQFQNIYWYAETFTKGNAYADAKTFAKSVAVETVDKLFQEKLVAK